MSPPVFSLDAQLEADTIPVGDLELCRVVLMNDGRFPWLILVPRRPECREIVDLAIADRAMLIEEVARCSTALKRLTAAEKLNVGAIGNRVAQLHVHVVARYASDPAWPGPVWGFGTSAPYVGDTGRDLAAVIWSALALM